MINIKEFLGLAYYTSGLDKFLMDFDKSHQKLSTSQHREVEKYRRIFALRDNPPSATHHETFWDKF